MFVGETGLSANLLLIRVYIPGTPGKMCHKYPVLYRTNCEHRYVDTEKSLMHSSGNEHVACAIHSTCDSTYYSKDIGMTPTLSYVRHNPQARKMSVARLIYPSQGGGLHVIQRSTIALMYTIYFAGDTFRFHAPAPLTSQSIRTGLKAKEEYGFLPTRTCEKKVYDSFQGTTYRKSSHGYKVLFLTRRVVGSCPDPLRWLAP